jgi:DNA invertase Pin-like site-specific DNA recombinase
LRSNYSDGGFSGGDTDRPALQRLLDDVRAGKIDVIVVYKVDRLTQSLTDFAKLVKLFDRHGVSFVSVTQQFNTTTSMGARDSSLLVKRAFGTRSSNHRGGFACKSFLNSSVSTHFDATPHDAGIMARQPQ